MKSSLACAGTWSFATGAKTLYERLRPLIVWLGLTELAWIGLWLLSGDRPSSAFAAIVAGWMALMLAWLAFVIYAGIHGFFLKHSRVLSNLIGVTSVVVFAVAVFDLHPTARSGLLSAASSTSDLQLISIHVLRLLAIGTVVKYLHGELPRHFFVFGSIPDLLFAVSAVGLAVLGANGPLDAGFLAVWHVIGILVFTGAAVSMYLSVPSPLRIFHNKPDTSIVFQFPMVLAPNFTVPLFIIAHLIALVKLAAS